MKVLALLGLVTSLSLPVAALAATCKPLPEDANLKFEFKGTPKMLTQSLGRVSCREVVLGESAKVVLMKLEHTGTSKEIWLAVRQALRAKGLDLVRTRGCRYEIQKKDPKRALKDNYACTPGQ